MTSFSCPYFHYFKAEKRKMLELAYKAFGPLPEIGSAGCARQAALLENEGEHPKCDILDFDICIRKL